jgi:hypothetical protein
MRRSFLLVAAISSYVISLSGAQFEQIVVSDSPRPLEKMTSAIEARCQCVITYEDVRYGASQVEDVTSSVRRDGNTSPKVWSPKSSFLSFPYDVTASSRGRSEVARNLDLVIALFNSSRKDGVSFRLVDTSEVFHVVPSGGSILSTRVEVSAENANAEDAIRDVLLQVAKAKGTKIDLFGMHGLLARTPAIRASGRADDVIVSILNSAERKLSWKLRYGFGESFYVLNLIDPTNLSIDR